MSSTVGDVAAVMDALYPPGTAQEWDAVGLVAGERSAGVDRVLYTVDVTSAVVAQARDLGAQLIIAHHPLLLRGVNSVSPEHPKGRLLTEMITNGIALLVAHTNADIPTDGTVDALSAALGLQDRRPLVPVPEQLDKIITFVPHADTQRVIDALADAGAGRIGNYERCAFTAPGLGTFRPLAGAHPHIGEHDVIEEVDEMRVEMVLRREVRSAVVAALQTSHPYETPAYDLFELAPVEGDGGLGRVGTLAAPESLRDFATRVAAAIPATATGVRSAGDPDRMISRVAVQAGAGDDLLDVARRTGADVYVTSDLRHHPASEALEWPGAPALIDIAHWAAEWLVLPRMQARVQQRLEAAGFPVDSVVSELCTDPWTAITPCNR